MHKTMLVNRAFSKVIGQLFACLKGLEISTQSRYKNPAKEVIL